MASLDGGDGTATGSPVPSLRLTQRKIGGGGGTPERTLAGTRAAGSPASGALRGANAGGKGKHGPSPLAKGGHAIAGGPGASGGASANRAPSNGAAPSSGPAVGVARAGSRADARPTRSGSASSKRSVRWSERSSGLRGADGGGGVASGGVGKGRTRPPGKPSQAAPTAGHAAAALGGAAAAGRDKVTSAALVPRDGSPGSKRAGAASKTKAAAPPGLQLAAHPLATMFRKTSVDKETREAAEEAARQHKRDLGILDDPRGEFAASALDAAIAMGDYNLGFKDTLSEGLFSVEHLVSVRLINQQYTTIPPRILDELTQLTTLSVRSNEIREVPKQIGQLTGLTDLSLMKNHLTRVPSSIGKLTRLTTLDISSNRLGSVPDGIGKLSNLQSLVLQENHLAGLPDTTGDMRALTFLDMSMCKLRVLTRGITKLPCLKTAIFSRNQIQVLPEAIGEMTSLTSLHLSNNDITELPAGLGLLVNLKELWLEWNQLQELPRAMVDLEALEVFKVDGNPLHSPPITVILQGVRITKEWCATNTKKGQQRRRQAIVWAIQQILKDALEQKLANPGHLVANVPHDFSDMIDLSAVVEVGSDESSDSSGDEEEDKKRDDYEAMDDAATKGRRFFKRGFGKVAAAAKAAKVLTEKKVKGKLAEFQKRDMWCYGVCRRNLYRTIIPAVLAWRRLGGDFNGFEYEMEEIEDALTFADKLGPAGIPRCPVYFKRCACVDEDGKRRVCVPPRIGFQCVRDGMLVRMTIKTSNQVKADKSRAHEERAVKTAYKRVRRECKAYFHSTDGEQWLQQRAEEELDFHEEAVELARVRHKKLVKRFQQVLKFEKKRNKLVVKRDRRKTTLRKKKAKVMEKANKAEDARRVELVNAAKDIRDTIKHGLKESAALDKLHSAVMKEHKDHMALDDETDEAERDAFGKIKTTHPMTGAMRAAESCPAYVSGIAEEVDALADFIQFTTEHTFTVFEYRKLIREEYISSRTTAAVDEVRTNYELMRKVAQSWGGMGLRKCFAAWRQWTAGRLVERARNATLDAERKQHEEYAKWAEEKLRAAEAAKWVEKVDPFTDEVYLEHSETGETTTEIPTNRPFKGGAAAATAAARAGGFGGAADGSGEAML